MHHTAVAPRVIEYPGSDGQPMAETPVHRDVMIDAIQILTRHFAERPDVYVSGNMLMYYEEGNPRKSVAPDVFVVVGASRDEDRDTYLLWREPKAPDFVLEVTSKSTRRNDQVTKRALYESLGVAEYFMFDPRAEYLNPPLQGFGLHRGRYTALQVVALPNGAPALYSGALGLFLHVRGQALRLHDPAAGKDLLTPMEEVSVREEAETRAEREARRPPGRRSRKCQAAGSHPRTSSARRGYRSHRNPDPPAEPCRHVGQPPSDTGESQRAQGDQEGTRGVSCLSHKSDWVRSRQSPTRTSTPPISRKPTKHGSKVRSWSSRREAKTRRNPSTTCRGGARQ